MMENDQTVGQMSTKPEGTSADVDNTSNPSSKTTKSCKDKSGDYNALANAPNPEKSPETAGDTSENDLSAEEEVSTFYKYINMLEDSLGFSFDHLSSWKKFVLFLHYPADPSSLSAIRMVFGILMFVDIPEERGLSIADLKWGEPDDCRFPLFHFLQPLPLHWMCICYMFMWMGAYGIMFGIFYKLSCISFVVFYWFVYILDKTSWNNHSYLFGVLGILFMMCDGDRWWSVDLRNDVVERNTDVPLWNYAILRFQLFVLYFYAGLKKTEVDWLTGRSMTDLAHHWVFYPFTFFLSHDEIDLYIVHKFAFFLDLTVGFWMLFDKTRPISIVFLTCFHMMNSQLFNIGMFPYVCLVTMTLFCNQDWPKRILGNLNLYPELVYTDAYRNTNCVYIGDYPRGQLPSPTPKQNRTVILLVVHVLLQLFLPYSHFITQGYNNWTNGLYGYSWDMMVHNWDSSITRIQLVNHQTNESIFIDPEAWVSNNKWQRHADMAVQYGQCVKRNLANVTNMENTSLYLDIWFSLNKRFHQRIFDPNVDILKAEWGPFTKTPWVMPLLVEFEHWRTKMEKIEKDVRSWSNTSDVLFMADFPDYTMKNFIKPEISNVTLEILEGSVSVHIEDEDPIHLIAGGKMSIPSSRFHEIHTISSTPSAFMYIFNNHSRTTEEVEEDEEEAPSFIQELQERVENILTSIVLISNAVMRVIYSIPMVRRVKMKD